MCVVGAVLLLTGAQAHTIVGEPFGLPIFAAAEGQLWVTWRYLRQEMQNERPIVARCRAKPDACTSVAALRFIAIVDEGKSHTGLSQLGRINRAVNYAIRSTRSDGNERFRTIWTSPLSALAAGVGDCKQYAMIKYAALLEVGIEPNDLRLVIVQLRSVNIAHAAIAVRHQARWYILDNNTLALVDAMEARDYQPLFALDHRGVWQFGPPRRPEVAALPCDPPVA